MHSLDRGQGGRPQSRQGGLVVSVDALAGESFEGRVIDLTDTSVLIEFPLPDGPDLPIAEATELVFTGENLASPRIANARVASWRGDGTSTFYRFTIKRSDSAALSIAEFEHRSWRITPCDDCYVGLGWDQEGKEESVSASLGDISESGVSALLGAEADRALVKAQGSRPPTDRWKLRVTTRLPGNEEPLSVPGWVLYRVQADSMIKYGVEFQSGVGTLPDGQVQTVAEHLIRYQDEVIRRATCLPEATAGSQEAG